MQVNDQVKVLVDAEEEHVGRAGMITSIAKNPDNADDVLCTVMLDETQTHEKGEAVYPESALFFLGR
jgi:hypothetical protein